MMASDETDRQRRTQLLFKVAAIAYCHLKATKVLALITEPLNAPLRSYDCLMLKGVQFHNAAELSSQAARLFGTDRIVEHTEFRDVRKADAE